jgi:hypothetical protein
MRFATLGGLAVVMAGATGGNPVYWGNASSQHGEVCLDLPAGLIDWRSLAVQSLGQERFAHPSPDVLRAGLEPELGNSVSVPFEAPIPASVGDRFWVVLYRGGAAPVIPTVLRGNVTYFFDSTLTLTVEPVAGGVACAPGRTPEAAAFYVSGATLRDPALDATTVTPVGRDTFAISVAGQERRFPRPSFAYPKVLHVTLFRRDPNGTIALIEWDPGDGSTCLSSFSLLILGSAGPRELLENGYDCDV